MKIIFKWNKDQNRESNFGCFEKWLVRIEKVRIFLLNNIIFNTSLQKRKRKKELFGNYWDI